MRTKILLLIAVLLSVSQLNAQVPTNGLLAYYPFNGNANDASGQGNNGTVNGAVLTADRLGNANSAYSFNGVNDYIKLPRPITGQNDSAWTVSTWVKADSTGVGEGGKSNMFYNPGMGDGCLRVFTDGTKKYDLEFKVVRTGSPYIVAATPENSTTFQWQHLVASYKKGDSLRIYLDGQLAGTTALDTSALVSVPSTYYNVIGAYVTSGGIRFPYKGLIDEFRLYNRTLSASEANALYFEGGSIAPAFVSTPDTNATEDIAWSYEITAADVDVGDTVTLSLLTKPAGMTLSGTTITWTPVNANVGVNNVRIRATDNHGAFSEQIFHIRVANVNDIPVAVHDIYTVNEDNVLNAAVPGILTNDTDPDGPVLTAVLVTSVTQGTLALNANGSFVYTPPANFNGTTIFTYRATDGIALSNIDTVTITVNSINDAPVAKNDTYTTAEDVPLSVGVPGILTNDTDVENQSLTAALVANVARGTLTLNENGSFAYTPPANYNGTAVFTYRAFDGIALSNTATVSITVTAVNDSPKIVSAAPTAAVQSQAFSYQAQAEDPDIGDVLTWQLITAPAGMSVSSSGLVSWTPSPSQVGSHNIVLQVKDAAGITAQQSFSITVTNVNDAPVINDPAVQTATEDIPFTFNLTATDPDGNQIFWFIVQGPDSLKINMSTGLLTWTPSQNVAGSTVQVKIRATDAVLSDTTILKITVTAVNEPPVITTFLPDTFMLDSLYSIPLTATDEENDTITWTALKKPSAANIVSNRFVWAPVAAGTDTIILVASDGTATDTLKAIARVLGNTAAKYKAVSALPAAVAVYWTLKKGAVCLTIGLPGGVNSGTVRIYDISGRMVESHNVSGNGWHTFTMQKHPAGILLARIQTGGKIFDRCIVSR